jgi:hypothetical protein
MVPGVRPFSDNKSTLQQSASAVSGTRQNSSSSRHRIGQICNDVEFEKGKLNLKIY